MNSAKMTLKLVVSRYMDAPWANCDQELFRRIGPIVKLDLKYDRAGRSEGTAYVVYESHEDAKKAIREYNGANANGMGQETVPYSAQLIRSIGQPIQLTMMPSGPAPRSRNPFDSAVMPGRPLAERISAPHSRARSLSPERLSYEDEDAARKGIDRYVPGRRSRSPIPRRRPGGRRPGARRDGGREQEEGRGSRGGSRRPKKTQEELDAEMEDYFTGGGNSAVTINDTNGNAGNSEANNDDIDMIE